MTKKTTTKTKQNSLRCFEEILEAETRGTFLLDPMQMKKRKASILATILEANSSISER